MPSNSGPPGTHSTGANIIQLRPTPVWTEAPAPAVTGNAVREPAADPAERDLRTELAVTVEAMFAAEQRTLSDPDTARAFQTGIDAALLAVDAALAQGAVSEYGHQQITNILINMRSAPTQL